MQDLVTRVVQRTSKSGNLYWCLEIEFPGTGYTKIVFLDNAEKALLGV